MPWKAHLQNLAILTAACTMGWLWNSGWPFLLLLFWLSPESKDEQPAGKADE